MLDQDTKAITEVVTSYFKGTYQGDAELVKSAFHPKAHITGCVMGENYDWTLDEFISRVTAKPTAVMKGEKYDKEIISLDKTDNTAIVKAKVLVGSLMFTDYISLLKIDGKWIIRHKSFTA